MKATVMVDNIGTETIQGEWGLSIYIEYKGKNILLDAGSTNLFLENAKKLGKSIEAVDYAVLSHAHYDHANGMMGFFTHNEKAKLYLQRAVKENCYKRVWLIKKYIGLPKGMLGKYQNRIVYASDDCILTEGVTLIPHKTPHLDEVGRREKMLRRENGRWVDDDFVHEQSLVFRTEKGLVVFNSCSHGGADTIVREIQSTYPGEKVYAIVGGFHLFRKTEEQVRAFAKRVKETGVERVYTGHCTGNDAFKILREELGDMVQQLHIGLVMEF